MQKGTGNTLVEVEGKYTQTLPTLTDGLQSELQVDAKGRLRANVIGITDFGLVGKPQGYGDFWTAYASATSFVCSGLPVYHNILDRTDILGVVQFNSSGAGVASYWRPDTIEPNNASSNVITISSASFGATDKFLVYTNIKPLPNATKVITGTQITLSDVATHTQDFQLPVDMNGVISLAFSPTGATPTTGLLATLTPLINIGGTDRLISNEATTMVSGLAFTLGNWYEYGISSTFGPCTGVRATFVYAGYASSGLQLTPYLMVN